MHKRQFLLLQGVSSPFFVRLAHGLQAAGHSVHKVNFNCGDIVYSTGLSTVQFRKPLEYLSGFLSDLYIDLGITDQVLFGDRRPVHARAIERARLHGIRNHVFEEGYFRPHWITLESEGVNRRSLLPKTSSWYLKASDYLQYSSDQVQTFRSPFHIRAWHDVCYHTASALNPIVFPFYQTHSNVSAPIEYAGYLKHIPKMKLVKKSEEEKINEIISSQQAFYLLPLQLNSDVQVRDHPVLHSMPILIEHVMQSFAQYAPQYSMLLIKNHPLDIGLTQYSKLIFQLANTFGISDRVVFFETGDLVKLVTNAIGVVTLNSTAGLVALEHGCPTVALGECIYHFAGLTDQTELDQFWKSLHPPNSDIFKSFKRTVLYATQVNGGFYSGQGIGLAVKGCVERLTRDQSRLQRLLENV